MAATSPLSLLKSSMAALHGDAPAYGGDAGAAATARPAAAAPSAVDVTMAQQLQDLAKQLSMQMDYNNELLSQLQRLEEQHLAYQKGAQEKQSALRQALAVADAARMEANDLKRKLVVAQVGTPAGLPAPAGGSATLWGGKAAPGDWRVRRTAAAGAARAESQRWRQHSGVSEWARGVACAGMPPVGLGWRRGPRSC